MPHTGNRSSQLRYFLNPKRSIIFMASMNHQWWFHSVNHLSISKRRKIHLKMFLKRQSYLWCECYFQNMVRKDKVLQMVKNHQWMTKRMRIPMIFPRVIKSQVHRHPLQQVQRLLMMRLNSLIKIFITYVWIKPGICSTLDGLSKTGLWVFK